MTETRVRRRALRRIVDAASVTDYVAITHTGARQVKLVSLTDTSTTGSGGDRSQPCQAAHRRAAGP
jgi:hypothetical protein